MSIKKALQLETGAFVKAIHIIPPFKIVIKKGFKPCFFEDAENKQQLIESRLGLLVKLISKREIMSNKGKNKKVIRQIDALRRIAKELKQEAAKEPLDLDKIDRLKAEMEQLQQKLHPHIING